MPTRRAIVQAGATIAAAAALAPVTLSAAHRGALPICRVLFDQRFAASRAFAAEAADLGAITRSVHDGVHTLWQRELYDRWTHSAIAVAGMTTHAALFCLDMVARDAGMQTIYRVHHRTLASRTVHEAFGPRQQLDGQLPADEPAWARASARRIMAWPTDLTPLSSPRSNIDDAHLRSVSPQTLITWIIAPVRRQRFRA